jgi:ribose-phosphate pyrophosphokinase
MSSGGASSATALPLPKKQQQPFLEAVDVVIVWNRKVLVYRRTKAPFEGRFALPGGLVDPAVDLNIYDAVLRKLRTKFGLTFHNPLDVRLFRRFSNPDSAERDPRSPSATTVFVADLDAIRSDVSYTGQASNPAKPFEVPPFSWDPAKDGPATAWAPLDSLIIDERTGRYRFSSDVPYVLSPTGGGLDLSGIISTFNVNLAFDHGLLLREVLENRHRRSTYRVIQTLSHPELGARVAARLGVETIRTNDGLFGNGECRVELLDSVRDLDVILVGTGSRSVYKDAKTGEEIPLSLNDCDREMQLLAQGCRKSGVRSITIVLAHFPYARSDKQDHRGPIGGKHEVDLYERMGLADRLISVDLHSGQIQGYPSVIPFVNLYAMDLFLGWLRVEMALSGRSSSSLETETKKKSYVLVSPDLGGVKRVESYAKNLQLPVAWVNKHRNYAEVSCVESVDLMGGEVQNKVCIVIDDMIDSAGTVLSNIKMLKENGALSVIVVATHGLFSGRAGEENASKALSGGLGIPVLIVCTDTVPLLSAKLAPYRASGSLVVLPVDTLLCGALSSIIYGGSLSQMFLSSRK